MYMYVGMGGGGGGRQVGGGMVSVQRGGFTFVECGAI